MSLRSREIEIYGSAAQVFGGVEDAYFHDLESIAAQSQVLIKQLSDLPQDGIVVDIGGRSCISAIVAARSSATRTVFSTGPVLARCDALKRTILANVLQNCRVLHVMIGHANMFYNCSIEARTGDLYREPSYNIRDDHRVYCTTLDGVADAFDITRMNLVNIESPGFEMEVLEGAGRSIANFNPVFVVLFQPFANVKQGAGDRHGAARFAFDRFGRFTAWNGGAPTPVSTEKEYADYVRHIDDEPGRMDCLVFGGHS